MLNAAQLDIHSADNSMYFGPLIAYLLSSLIFETLAKRLKVFNGFRANVFEKLEYHRVLFLPIMKFHSSKSIFFVIYLL